MITINQPSLTEPSMKKQMNMDTSYFWYREKASLCYWKRESYTDAEKASEKTEEAPEETVEAETAVMADGGAGTSGTSTMNLPYHSMSFINDKEVKMASGHKITVVVGDLAQQKVRFWTIYSHDVFYEPLRTIQNW